MILVVAKSMHTRGKLETSQHRETNLKRKQANSHKEADCSSIVICCVLENGQKGSSRGIDNAVKVCSDEEQHDEEDRTSHGSNYDAADHNLGTLNRGIGDLYFNELTWGFPIIAVDVALPSIMWATPSYSNVSRYS